MKDLLSIVVPVYNVENYLCDCIESIINQTYDNIEIILVDDGSTDRSGQICDDYTQKYSNIKTIHQCNGGLTKVRKEGVKLSQGKYIGFVDGDDWIEPNMYDVLYHYAITQEVDIVTSAGYREYDWGTGNNVLGDTLPRGKYEVHSSDEYILKHVFSSSFGDKQHINGAVWNKLFKREIIYTILNEMDDNIHGFMDDNVCVVGAVIISNRIYISGDCLYHHRERQGAFEYSTNPNGLMQVNYAYLGLKKIIEKFGYKEKLYTSLCEHTSIRIIQAINNMFESDMFKIPKYLFRCKDIPLRAKVVLYGAGNVGKDFEKQFRAENKYQILGFIDRDVDGFIGNTKIYKISELSSIQYDYIIIAIASRQLAKEIEINLVHMGVKRSSIIWERPLSVIEYFNNGLANDEEKNINL